MRQRIDDPRYIAVDLDFDTSEHAQAFLAFLETNVSADPVVAPAVAGAPQARVLHTIELT